MNTVQLKTLQQVKIDDFTQGYIEAAFFTDAENLPDIVTLDAKDLAPDAIGRIAAECMQFQQTYSAALKRAYGYKHNMDAIEANSLPDYDAEQAGRDFWFTRNRHGAGYWDRGLGKPGDDLTEAAHTFSEVSLVLGDDGKIYQE